MATVQLANFATLMLASSTGMGGSMTRSLLAMPRLLQENWNPGWGTYFPVGTVIPSYLYNATAPPPYAQTTSNVTVIGCNFSTYDCECLILGKKCQAKSKILSKQTKCANFNGDFKPAQDLLWVLIVGAIFACVMAFGIGSNDSANSWATSIGSGAIRSVYGLFIGGLMEWAGAVLLGYSVSSTVRRGIAPLDTPECWACGYCHSKMSWYMAAMCATLVGATSLVMLATFLGMPVSTTHSVIGGACGATIAATSWSCLNWSMSGGLGAIALSWVTSPILSGLIAAASYLALMFTAINRANPRKHALIAVVACSFMTTFTTAYLVMLKSYYTKTLPQWIMLTAGFGGAGVVALLVALIMVPMLRKRWPSQRLTTEAEDDLEMSKAMKSATEKIDEEDDEFAMHESAPSQGARYQAAVRAASTRSSAPAGIGGSIRQHSGSVKSHFEAMGAKSGFMQSMKDALDINQTPEEVLNYEFIPEEIQEAKKSDMDLYTVEQRDGLWAFRYLLVYQAALESFAHGANDTANATGAFMAVYNSYSNGMFDCNQTDSNQWIMVIAGFFVALGVNTFGYKVVRTIGTDMADVNFLKGWCIEFASTFAVVGATVLGMPVSTTHCVVGAVVFVGMVAYGLKGVAWFLFLKIFIGWVATLPIAGIVAYCFSWLFSLGVRA